jgi:hypothetical protein
MMPAISAGLGFIASGNLRLTTELRDIPRVQSA